MMSPFNAAEINAKLSEYARVIWQGLEDGTIRKVIKDRKEDMVSDTNYTFWNVSVGIRRCM